MNTPSDAIWNLTRDLPVRNAVRQPTVTTLIPINASLSFNLERFYVRNILTEHKDDISGQNNCFVAT